MLICCSENYLVTDKPNLEESALLIKRFLWRLQGFVSWRVMNIYVSEKIPHFNCIFGDFPLNLPQKIMTFPASAQVNVFRDGRFWTWDHGVLGFTEFQTRMTGCCLAVVSVE